MKTVLVLGIAGWTLATTATTVLAQQVDSNPTWATVAVLMGTWQRTEEDTVRKQVVLTLEKMGAPVARPLARVMEDEFRLAATANTAAAKQKHLDTVIIAAKILSRQGNAIARDEYVTEILLAFTHESKKAGGAVHPVDADVRVAAIDALGRIFAQKAVFLVLQSPNELTKEKNKEALTVVEHLRNESQVLKKNITLLVTSKDKEAAEADKARDLVLATRNLYRKFKLYQKLGFIMSELEPPTGKEKDLNTRIVQALGDIEGSLRDVWAPEKDDKLARRRALAKAEMAANDLCDEMDDLLRRVDGWLQMNDRTRKVILTFQDALRSVRENPSIVNICAAEALGRVYGNRD